MVETEEGLESQRVFLEMFNQIEILWWSTGPLSTNLLYIHVGVISSDLGIEKQK